MQSNKLEQENSDQMRHIFQPIYHLQSWLLYGYESFLRVDPFSSPQEWFKQAQKNHRKEQMDIKSMMNALTTFYYTEAKETKRSPMLFINIFPTTLVNHDFQPSLEKIVEAYKINPRHIILEINEDQPAELTPRLKSHVNALRNAGFSIALDNFGTGEVSFSRIMELEPQFIKVDHFFSKNLSHSNKKQKFLRHLSEVIQDDCHIILEGIEQPIDLAIAKALGIEFGQGYVFGKPSYQFNP